MTDKQERCRYHQPPFKKWDSGYWDEVTWQINRYRDDVGLHYELIGIGYVPDNNIIATLPTEISFCPKCGADLSEVKSND